MEIDVAQPLADNASNVHWGDRFALNTALAGAIVIGLLALINLIGTIAPD